MPFGRLHPPDSVRSAPLTTTEWLLMFHITAAFLLVGGAVAAGILNTIAITSARPSDSALLLRLVRTALPLMYIGALGTLVFGLVLWHDRSYSLGAAWLWLSLALWVLANALGGIGGRYQGRARKLAEQLAAKDDAPSDELRALLRDRRGNAYSYAAGLALLAILVLMIWKPGS
jgi:uncharacterized membrane protein